MDYNIDDVKSVLRDNAIKFPDKKIIYNLYSVLSKLYDNDLTKYENDIYINNNNNKLLTDQERVGLEIESLLKKVNENQNNAVVREILILMKQAYDKGELSSSLIAYFKKLITEIQIILGEDITFYSVAEELFDEKMLKLIKDNKEYKERWYEYRCV